MSHTVSGSSNDSNRYLTEEQVAKFRNDGYLVVPNFFTPEQTLDLLARAHQLLDDFSLEGHPMTRFATGEVDNKPISDDYFLNSNDKIRFFFEEGAFDDKGNLTRPKERAINKFGHALHELDPVFQKMTFTERTKQIARDLAVHRDPRVLQSMVICKQPQIGGNVPVHEDSMFLYTKPESALGFWFALENCRLSPVDNGCLSFVPGSHKRNKCASRFVRLPEGGCGFVPVAGVEPSGIDWEKERWKTEEVDAGSLVLIDGMVIHRSLSNRSDRSRFIYTFHMIEGELPYPKDNWLQPTKDMPFAKLYER